MYKNELIRFFLISISILSTYMIESCDVSFKSTFHQVVCKNLYDKPYKHTLEINVRDQHAGFFSWFKGIVGCLEYYEQHADIFTDITIDLRGGPYAYPDKDTNWWLSYFEPISIINEAPQLIHDEQASYTSIFNPNKFALMSLSACNKGFPRERAHYLINKYLKIKPFIQKQINDFATEKFNNDFIIGIHYRGTDKISEAPSITYQHIYRILDEVIQARNCQSYKIFVATDEQAFLDDIVKKYSSVIYVEQHRSTNNEQAVHVGPQPVTMLQRGIEALVDCVLLSKCNVMIVKTQSNLSSSAADFNPTMPIIMLNNAYPELR